jgi:transcriptional regulator with PAS, ATPase and Fis domain
MNRSSTHAIVGDSEQIHQVLQLVEQVAGTHATVLIRGETGSGKELVALALHHSSPRAAQPFVVVDCASIHENLLQSELFGHERGAYTGAVGSKRGLFEAAHRGTLFLDEIAELTPALQVKLLRVLESGTFRRVGGTTDVHVDVRLVAATNRALEAMIEEGGFREDLFYRLNAFPIDVPPLRAHPEDIPLLARHFIRMTETPDVVVSEAAMERLIEYRWPGNVRELAHAIERALILCTGGVIMPEHLPPRVQHEDVARAHSQEESLLSLHELELKHILRVLEEHRGNRENAASALGISERTLYRRLKETHAPHLPAAGRSGAAHGADSAPLEPLET